MNILLPVHPHSTAFKNVIAFYYYVIPIHTNVQWRRFSVHLPAETSRVAILNVKPQVYLNKSCTTSFGRRGYGLKENYAGDYFGSITIPAFHADDLKGVTIT